MKERENKAFGALTFELQDSLIIYFHIPHSCIPLLYMDLKFNNEKENTKLLNFKWNSCSHSMTECPSMSCKRIPCQAVGTHVWTGWFFLLLQGFLTGWWED